VKEIDQCHDLSAAELDMLDVSAGCFEFVIVICEEQFHGSSEGLDVDLAVEATLFAAHAI